MFTQCDYHAWVCACKLDFSLVTDMVLVCSGCVMCSVCLLYESMRGRLRAGLQLALLLALVGFFLDVCLRVGVGVVVGPAYCGSFVYIPPTLLQTQHTPPHTP